MSATPKAQRAAPPRRFENYILTRSTAASVNLTNVHDNKFLPCSPASLSETQGGDKDPGRGYSDDGISVAIDIGFDFQIDGVTYNKFVVCTNGWMALVDPATGTFNSTEVLNSQVWINSAIRTTFSTNVILLAPWFDDLRNVAANTTQYAATSSISSQKIERINRGLESPPTFINATKNSVKYFQDVRSTSGRRLIVRWNSLSDFSSPSTILRFEVVIYENGKIEYRYSPRSSINIILNAASPEDATIGIFMPGGTDRFRDFSYGLGYRDNARQQYRYGGAVVDATYTDTDDQAFTSNYTCNLKPFTHWPGLGSAGSMFTFSPPVNRRRVLPRNELRRLDNRLVLPTVARTGDTRMGNDQIIFDDRRTLAYISGVLINAPSMMQRFYGDSEPTSVTRQDLFAGDFEFTGSVVRAVVEQFIQGDIPAFIEPFSEHKLFENDAAAATDDFFTSGSSVDALGDGLTQPLKAKTQIRFSLPINNVVQLLGTSSTIHYYNVRSNAWEVPQNSSYVIANGATTNTSGTPKGDIVPDRTSAASALRILEDHKGFGPIGNTVTSGSHNPSGNSDQTDANIGLRYTTGNATMALNKTYAKSVPVNEEYRANADEVIKLPINHPFLIERAVIEIPFAAGDGWFADRTQCMSTLENNAAGGFDFGGPGLTVALFNQTFDGDGARSRRDLIMSGVITHSYDNVHNIVFSTFPPITSTYQIRPRGYLAHGGTPGAVVTPVGSVGSRTFTGSAAVKCEAGISNGVIVKLELAMTSSNIQSNKSGVIDVFNSALLPLVNRTTTHYSQSCYIAYINNFGRGGTGFDPSGRSIFGKEFITQQLLNEKGQIANPFYLTGTAGGAVSPTFKGLPQQYINAIAAGNTFKFEMALPLQNFRPSPYLVLPSDTLVLAISKSRPVFYGSQTPGLKTSGSIQHDVQLLSGAVNIVLYGSLLRENKEFHDTLNQPLASDAIHEIVVGNEPTLDQFNIAYREQYISGFSDDFVTGSLVTKSTAANHVITLTTGSRGRVLSKFRARTKAVPDTSTYELSVNPTKSFRLQPWFERCGTPRVTNHFDSSERYWDTLMPDVTKAFAQDNAVLFTIAPSDNNFLLSGNFDYSNTAFVRLDTNNGAFPKDTSINVNWSKSFPFEPRYASATRQVDFQKSFVAKTRYDQSVSLPMGEYTFPTDPVKCDSLVVGFIATALYYNLFLNYYQVIGKNGWYVDVNLRTTVTGAMVTNDTAKALFGFGDLNTCKVAGYGGDFNLPGLDSSREGSNNYPEGRVINYDDIPGLGSDPRYTPANIGFSHFHISPVIRGWKYGVKSGIAEYTHATFRTDKYGQLRDMLEQRPYSKFYITSRDGRAASVSEAAISVKFVDATGKLTQPENTWSQNLSLEATSSMPYFDGETRNRQSINKDTLNANIITFKSNQFGQVTL